MCICVHFEESLLNRVYMCVFSLQPQYEFLYEAVIEYYHVGGTVIPGNIFRNTCRLFHQEGPDGICKLDRQFRVIMPIQPPCPAQS